MSENLKDKLKKYRLTQLEYNKMCELLQREPKEIEWPLFSALWSEHCSYKSSKIHLKKFAKTLNKTVVNANGENAGVIDIGAGERIAFKMESHNHPSFIEPYQGAATGVGGILRDIFTMGARPIASANYLCFGDVFADRMNLLVDGVVRGIGGYGNCVGVPTITGQTNFDSSYNKNILVNAMSVGLFRPQEKIALSAAQGPGNLVVYIGAKTGRDGVHGAAMASESFENDSESKKPNVQIGDPYFEKLLIEGCRHILQRDLVVGIQDMGAAGLTSSSFEMASKGQVGMKINLDLVPVRDSLITPEEILLSESQERMLLVCEPDKFEEIKSVMLQWSLDANVIGVVIEERKIQLYWKSDLLTSIDPDLLVENAPVYDRKYGVWKSVNRVNSKQDLHQLKLDLNSHIKQQLVKPEFGSRAAIYRQFDQRVGAKTAHGADSDVGILQLPDSGRGLGIVVGCRPSVMKMDARLGALDAVFYPALQLAAKGLKTLAITDCLNFGNPEKESVMTEFVTSVDAITEASIALNAPVVSGNVSFYNETLGESITSTPATGLIGLRENVSQLPADRFVHENDRIFSVKFKAVEAYDGKFTGELDINSLVKFINGIRELSMMTNIIATQVVGEAGLAMTLAKMSIEGKGILSDVKFSDDVWIHQNFYEVIFETESHGHFLNLVTKHLGSLGERIAITDLGAVSDGKFQINNQAIMLTDDLNLIYQGALNSVIPFGVNP